MKIHSHFFTDLAAGILLFGGSLILAQTRPEVKATATTTTSSSSAADTESLNSAHATESVQKKEIVGVKDAPSKMRIKQGIPNKQIVSKPSTKVHQ